MPATYEGMSVQVPSSTSPPPQQEAWPMTYSHHRESTPTVRQLSSPASQSTGRVRYSAPVQASGMGDRRRGQSQSRSGPDDGRGTHEATPHIPRQCYHQVSTKISFTCRPSALNSLVRTKTNRPSCMTKQVNPPSDTLTQSKSRPNRFRPPAVFSQRLNRRKLVTPTSCGSNPTDSQRDSYCFKMAS